MTTYVLLGAVFLALLIAIGSLRVAISALKESKEIKPLAIESVSQLYRDASGEEHALPMGTIALLPLQVETFLVQAQASHWKKRGKGDEFERSWRGKEFLIEVDVSTNGHWSVELSRETDAHSRLWVEKNEGLQGNLERAKARASETMLEMILRVGCMTPRSLPPNPED